jgi:hypothetical protein
MGRADDIERAFIGRVLDLVKAEAHKELKQNLRRSMFPVEV